MGLDMYLFPAPLEAWVVSYETKPAETKPAETFPSPLEVWVGSYQYASRKEQTMTNKSFRPLSRVGWVPTQVRRV